MTIKPKEITRKGCSLRLAAAFNEWKDENGLLVNFLDYLQENHTVLPISIVKDRFITEFSITGPLNIEQDLQGFQEAGYIVIEGNSITFTEKFMNSWQKTYEFQQSKNNFSSNWDCNC